LGDLIGLLGGIPLLGDLLDLITQIVTLGNYQGWKDFWSYPTRYLESLLNAPEPGGGEYIKKTQEEIEQALVAQGKLEGFVEEAQDRINRKRVAELSILPEQVILLNTQNEALKEELSLREQLLEAFPGVLSEESLGGRPSAQLRAQLREIRERDFDRTTRFTTTTGGDFLNQFRANRAELERERTQLKQLLRDVGATGDPQEQKAIVGRINEINEELTGKVAKAKTTWQEYYGQSTQLATQFFELQATFTNNQLNAVQREIELNRQKWQEQSEGLREAGLESSVYYRNLKRQFEATEKAKLARQESLQAKAFEQQKASNIAGTIMAGAQSFVEALPNFILSALVAAVTAGQVALIASQANPFRRRLGGFINETGRNRDDVPLLVSGGEMVINRESTRRNRDLLEDINAGRSVRGGNITINIHGNFMGSQDEFNRNVVPQIKKAIKDNYLQVK
jgi:hypothetical protein